MSDSDQQPPQPGNQPKVVPGSGTRPGGFTGGFASDFAARELTAGERQDPILMPLLIYLCYLVSVVLQTFLVVGVVAAYIGAANSPDWLRSHYRWQIRSFWIGILYATVGAVVPLTFLYFGYEGLRDGAMPGWSFNPMGMMEDWWIWVSDHWAALIGPVIAAGVWFVMLMFWWLIRALRGLAALLRGAPVARVTSWFL